MEKSTVVFSILTRIVILSVLLLKMAAIEMVQMLIEAAEYLDRRERGTVTYNHFCMLGYLHVMCLIIALVDLKLIDRKAQITSVGQQ